MSGRPRKQEQFAPDGEVVTVAPGVLRAQLPVDLPGLGHVNCYLLEDERGVAVVDPGLPSAASYKALRSLLATAGFPVSRVHTVIVTHSHPDHFGGAGRLRQESGADIVTSTRFRLMWDPAEPPDVDLEDLADLEVRMERRFPWDPMPWGGPGIDIPLRRKMLFKASRRFPRLMRAPVPTARLDDADTIRLGGKEWVAIHTPGHTDDHLCLFDPTDGIMLSGDHVLPTITPHISGLVLDPDPLGTFYESLDKVAAYGPDVSVVLPAHGLPFSNLAHRVDDIKEHHDERLDRLRRAAGDLDRPADVAEFSTHLFSERVQGPMADSETFAHLEHLRRSGDMTRAEGEHRFRYLLAD